MIQMVKEECLDKVKGYGVALSYIGSAEEKLPTFYDMIIEPLKSMVDMNRSLKSLTQMKARLDVDEIQEIKPLTDKIERKVRGQREKLFGMAGKDRKEREKIIGEIQREGLATNIGDWDNLIDSIMRMASNKLIGCEKA